MGWRGRARAGFGELDGPGHGARREEADHDWDVGWITRGAAEFAHVPGRPRCRTQATIRGIIDRVAPDVGSLLACAWNDVACFVTLGEHDDSRVLVVGDLSKHDDRYTLRVARINVELGQVIAEYHLQVDPQLAAIDIANDAMAGLTGEVIAAPRAIAPPSASRTATDARPPASTGPTPRHRRRMRGSDHSPRTIR